MIMKMKTTMMMMMMMMMMVMYDRKRTAWPAKCPRQSITYRPPTVQHRHTKNHNFVLHCYKMQKCKNAVTKTNQLTHSRTPSHKKSQLFHNVTNMKKYKHAVTKSTSSRTVAHRLKDSKEFLQVYFLVS